VKRPEGRRLRGIVGGNPGSDGHRFGGAGRVRASVPAQRTTFLSRLRRHLADDQSGGVVGDLPGVATSGSREDTDVAAPEVSAGSRRSFAPAPSSLTIRRLRPPRRAAFLLSARGHALPDRRVSTQLSAASLARGGSHSANRPFFLAAWTKIEDHSRHRGAGAGMLQPRAS